MATSGFGFDTGVLLTTIGLFETSRDEIEALRASAGGALTLIAGSLSWHALEGGCPPKNNQKLCFRRICAVKAEARQHETLY